MTDADEPAVRRVSTDGITVEKSLAEDRFPVPAVHFQITSDLEDSVEIRLTDVIPDAVPMDHIGFHPEFESEHWTAFSDHRVRFERPIEPGEEVETVYGIRDDESFEPEAFLSDPSVSAIDPTQAVMGIDTAEVQELLADGLPEDAEGLVQEMLNEQDGHLDAGPGSAISDNGSGSDPFETDDVAGAEDLEPNEESSTPLGSEMDSMGEPAGFEDLEDLDAPPSDMDLDIDQEPLDEDSQHDDALFRDPEQFEESLDAETEEFAVEGDSEMMESAGSSTSDDRQTLTDNLASALLEDLRSGQVDQDLQTALRDEILGGEIPPSMEVRLRHLQSRVEDLSAYTDAIESFLDGQGTASVIEEMGSEIERVSETVSDLERELSDERSQRDEITQQMASIEETLSGISAVDEDLSEVRTQVDNLESRLSSTQSELDGTTEDVGAIRSEVRALSDDVAELSERMDEIDEVSETVTGLRDDLQQLDEDIEQLMEQQESLESWRETVSDAFGG